MADVVGGGLEGAPDIGTIGGTVTDPYGENSATLGGYTSPAQEQANSEVNANPWGYDFNMAGFTDPGAFSLGSMFGYNSPSGLPDTQGEFAGNVGDYGFSDFASSPFGRGLRGILGLSPFGQVANMGIDAALGKPVSQIAVNAIPGQLGAVSRAGLAAYNSPNAPASLGKSALGYGLGTLGSQVGYGLAGPVGAVAGGMLGSSAAGLRGGPSTSTASTTGGGINLGNIAEGLAGLYTGYQGMKQAGALGDNAASTNQAIQTQMASLNDMYSPNSPYARQLAQQLARKDAAAGRNSQYGPRAVELQARLAALAPTVANSMSSLAGAAGTSNAQAQTANTNRQIAQAQLLAKLGAFGKSTGLTDWAQKGLSGMFSNNTPQYLPEQTYGGEDTVEYT